jgi:hypothetical protein
VPFVIIGFIFNYVIRRRHFAWWSKYNCSLPYFLTEERVSDHSILDVLSAGLDSAYAIGSIFIFFVLQYPANDTIGANTIQTWWGNVGYSDTVDGNRIPFLELAPGETFGPVWGNSQ